LSGIGVDDLTPGMTLSEDVVGADGRVLLLAGTVLTEATIEALRSRGLTEVAVAAKAEPSGVSAFEIADKLLPAADYVSMFFQYADPGHEAVLEIFRLTVDRMAKRMAEGFTPHMRLDEELPNAENLDLDDFLRDDGSPEDLVTKEVELCSLPDVYFRIMDVLKSNTSSVSAIAEVIAKDPSLSARLLKLVNSAFYGFPSKVDTIPRAVMIIGVAELSMLAAGVSTIQAFTGIPEELVNMREFWKHSIACGVLARNIARRKAGLSPERLFVGGLLHDIGRLVMYKRLPRASTQALLFSRFNGLPFFEAEKDVLGFEHARIGAMLMKEWKFPSSLSNMVKFHHNPAAAVSIIEPAIIHLANSLAVSGDIAAGGMTHFPGIQEQAWNALEMSVDAIAPTLAQSEKQIIEIVRIFLDE